jgi:uncharacterized glyoxalase superfamily protein PhnB
MPDLYYEDADAALEFLTRAFGFSEKFRLPGEDRKIGHAEVSMGNGVVMFGTPSADYRNPRNTSAPRRSRSTSTSTTWTLITHRRRRQAPGSRRSSKASSRGQSPGTAE